MEVKIDLAYLLNFPFVTDNMFQKGEEETVAGNAATTLHEVARLHTATFYVYLDEDQCSRLDAGCSRFSSGSKQENTQMISETRGICKTLTYQRTRLKAYKST